MGHQIGKDGISLKSKMNVLKSMVPSVIGHHKKKKMGGRWAICPWNKKEKDGHLKKKKKVGQTPIFLMHFFGAHLSGNPTND